MKPLLTLVLAISVALTSFSQAKECKVSYHKGDKIAATLELPYSPGLVEDAIKDYLSKKCLRKERSRGFDIFRSARLKKEDPEMNDVHCKVERKARNSAEESVIYLLIGRPGENVSVRTPDDHYKLDEAKVLLNELVGSINSFSIAVKLKNQEDLVKKAEQKLEDLEAEQKDMEKKMKSLQEKLAQNKNEQQKQNEEIIKQRTALASIKGKANQ